MIHTEIHFVITISEENLGADRNFDELWVSGESHRTYLTLASV